MHCRCAVGHVILSVIEPRLITDFAYVGDISSSMAYPVAILNGILASLPQSVRFVALWIAHELNAWCARPFDYTETPFHQAENL